MAKQPKGELVVVGASTTTCSKRRSPSRPAASADRIRERVKKTVEDIIDVGNDLLAVKEALPHGQFGPWLKAEFGWSERSAQNFMSRGRAVQIRKICGFADPAQRRLPARRPRRPRRGPPGRRREGRGRRRDHLRHGQGDRGRGEEEAATEAAEGGARPTSWACGW